jgi:hypothetical protein
LENNGMNEIAMLQNLAIANRTAYRNKQSQSQKVSDRASENSAQILGYDSTTGRYRVQNSKGQIFSAKAISNSGALAKGNKLSLSTPVGGIPIIDAMPS